MPWVATDKADGKVYIYTSEPVLLRDSTYFDNAKIDSEFMCITDFPNPPAPGKKRKFRWADVVAEPKPRTTKVSTADFNPQDRPIPAAKLARILFDAFDNLRRSEPDKLNAYDICEAFRDIAQSIAHPLREGEQW